MLEGLVVSAAADTCFRAAVGASAPFRAWFEDEGHQPRGPSSAARLVPPEGPVCARRGERLRLVVTGTHVGRTVDAFPRTVRAVVWQAP